MKQRPNTLEYQMLHDIANSKIFIDRQHNSSKGVYKQLYEGQPGPLSVKAVNCLKTLTKNGLVETTHFGTVVVVRLTMEGKLRWAQWQS